ncbi:MAG TPA: 5-dehydro-2-deoxygluconokinase [Gaiellaceae bacterium]|nr:5-dehydro-2-deoxygluconokinase [Gaiellaceae bacterium]
MTQELEVLTVGRVGVDFYADEPHAGFGEARTFQKSVGGSPTNVAVAAARLGRRAAVFTKVGDDGLGAYVRDALAEQFGVDTRFVGTDSTLQTPIVVAVMDPPEDPQFVFYRQPRAPDSTIQPDEVDMEVVRTVPVLWISAGALAVEPSRGTVRTLLAERAVSRHTILDLDYRASFWSAADEARREIGSTLDVATAVLGNRAECEIAVGSSEPDAAADALLDRGVELAIVKLGGDGVLVATSAGRAVVPPVHVEVVSGLGAGDAFGGALCHGLLSGWSPVEAVEFANAAGALVASRLLCADAMPTVVEVRELLEGSRARR